VKFRSVIFWIHLVAGITAGVIILIMSATGAAIAFEKEILAWFDRDARTIAAGAPAERLSVDTLLAQWQEKNGGTKPGSITVLADPQAAVQIGLGRTNTFFLNPLTGATQESKAGGARAFFRWMTDWHRWLGQNGSGRATGKAITGACNTAFLFLALSGLYLWWPRKWSWANVKNGAVLKFNLRGRARDWNWHNAVGLWCAPILVILTASGMIISYRWASNLVYQLAGETPPPAPAAPISPRAPGGPRPGTRTNPALNANANSTLAAALSTPVPAAAAAREQAGPGEPSVPLGPAALFRALQGAVPDWEQLTLRLEGERARTGAAGSDRDKEKGKAAPVVIAVRAKGMWPLFGADQYSLDPYTGAIVRTEKFGDYTTGRKIRTWLRFLHTGEALGIPGKIVAAGASLGGVILVWTGFALAWRRFRTWRAGRTEVG
jgi:uncharacterized iron-regulated membrane protein